MGKGKRVTKENNKKSKAGVIIFILFIIILAGLGAIYYYYNYMNKEPGDSGINLGLQNLIPTESKEKKESIFSGNDRPIAVMIDNHHDAWPQAGLNDTYAVYEIIVEGGETRLMALFKGKDLDKIGPIRSSRHYFLDYALENDAIYVHYGWSPKAEYDIKALGVNNINGITEKTSDFWRIKQKAAPHNVLTSTKKILKIANDKKYRVTSTDKSVLQYSTSEINLNDGKIANTVTIPYSTLHTTSYKYDESTKKYTRYARGEEQKDFVTKKPITTKNIIITFIKNSPLKDKENKDRQDLDDLGTKDGYYITNGKAEKIKCIKTARNAKTIYKDLSGNEIKVNDGNTFFNICPIDSEVKFE